MVARNPYRGVFRRYIDEIEEYLPFESYLLLKVKIDTANMSEVLP